MHKQHPKELVPRFFDNTARTYDKIVAYTTLGKDRFWKENILKQITEATSILDLACGTGILTRMIATKFPNAKIIGIDITENYLDIAKRNSKNYDNISFIHQDAELLDLNLKFDYIVSSYIPKYCNPEILIKKSIEHLNTEGKIIFHDFIYPKNNSVRKLWKMYFRLLNFIGFLIPSWKEPFFELPELIKNSTWLNDYSNTMKKNGLKTTYEKLTFDTCAILTGIKI